MTHGARGSRVLVVDDEASITQLLDLALTMDGFVVTKAHSGREALRMVHDCDLMVLDLMMPEMDGLTVIRHVRESPDLAELPVVMLTAKTDGVTAALARAAGVSAFHTKPVNLPHLTLDIRALLGQDPTSGLPSSA